MDAHRSLLGYDLGAILSVQTGRTVASDYTVRHGSRRYQIERRSIVGGLRRGRVLVEERLDGSLRLRFRDRYLHFQEVEPLAARPPVGSAPRVAGACAPPPVAAAPATRRPAADHPWRQPYNRTLLSCRKPDISTLR